MSVAVLVISVFAGCSSIPDYSFHRNWSGMAYVDGKDTTFITMSFNDVNVESKIVKLSGNDMIDLIGKFSTDASIFSSCIHPYIEWERGEKEYIKYKFDEVLFPKQLTVDPGSQGTYPPDSDVDPTKGCFAFFRETIILRG
ncbi:MAG: hypothetical protein LDL53_07235 [Candidatus Hydrogenedens sp.]|nr:hypothetical protein [Candidatus Hydrogenedens sp.]